MFGVTGPGPTADWKVLYKDYDELIAELNRRMAGAGYKVVRARSHRSRVNSTEPRCNDVVRVDLVCNRGGRPYKCHATKHRTTTKKTGCPWKAKAVNRKTLGGWVLTVVCADHNHEPGTPEPPSPLEDEEEEQKETEQEGEEEEEEEENMDAVAGALTDHHTHDQGRPQVNDVVLCAPSPSPPDTAFISTEDVLPIALPSASDPDDEAAVLGNAGVPGEALRLDGDTFQRLKLEYRKLSKADRFDILSQLQLRIAAIYAVENQEVQRQQRQEAQERSHAEAVKATESCRRAVEQIRARGAVASAGTSPPARTLQLQIQTAGGGACMAQPPDGAAQHQHQLACLHHHHHHEQQQQQQQHMQQTAVYLQAQAAQSIPHSIHYQPEPPDLLPLPLPLPQIPDFGRFAPPVPTHNGVLHPPQQQLRGHQPVKG